MVTQNVPVSTTLIYTGRFPEQFRIDSSTEISGEVIIHGDFSIFNIAYLSSWNLK